MHRAHLTHPISHIATALALMSASVANATDAPGQPVQLAQLQTAQLQLATNLNLGDAPATSSNPEDVVSTPEVQPLPYVVSINGRNYGDAVLLRLANGHLLARESDIGRWRLKPPVTLPFALNGDNYYELDMLPGFVAELDSSQGTVALQFASEAFTLTRYSSTQREYFTPQKPQSLGGFINYDLVGFRQEQSGFGEQNNLSGFTELGLFNHWGSFNSGWLGNNLTDENNGPFSQKRRFVRLESTFTHDEPATLRTFVIGDTVSGSGILGNPLQIGGLRYSRNFATQPGFITLPQASLTGDAALPSVLEVFIDGVRRDSRDLPPGPFQIDALPNTDGLGEVQVVVRDLLGREQVLSASYFTGSRQLAKGLNDFSYEAGFLRERYGIADADYGDLVAIATHRYGFSDRFTGEVHAELQDTKLQNIGVGSIWSLLPVGLITSAVAYSHSDFGNGVQGVLGVQHTVYNRLSYGAQFTGATEDFRTAGVGLSGQRPSRQLTANVRYPVARSSGIGLAYFNILSRQPNRVTEFLTASYSTRFKYVNLGVFATERFEPTEDLSINLRVTAPLGLRNYASGNYNYRRNAAGQNSGEITTKLQSGLPNDEGWGYGVELRQNHGEGAQQPLRTQLNVARNFDYGTAAVDVAHRSGQTSYRASLGGAVGAFGNHLFASRRVTDAFALVETGVPDITLTVQNQPAGRSKANGVAVLPRLLAYYGNRVSIDTTNLPMIVEIDTNRVDVTPYFRSGLLVSLPAKITNTAVMTLLRANGKPVPAGSSLSLGTAEFPVGKNGLAYLNSIAIGQNTATARWESGSCIVQFNLPADAGFQPDLGTLQCLEVQP